MTGMPYVLAKGPEILALEDWLNPGRGPDASARRQNRERLLEAVQQVRPYLDGGGTIPPYDQTDPDNLGEAARTALTNLVNVLADGLGEEFSEQRIAQLIFRWTGLQIGQQWTESDWGTGWWERWRGSAGEILCRGLELTLLISLGATLDENSTEPISDGNEAYPRRRVQFTWKCPGPRFEVWVESSRDVVSCHLVTPGIVTLDASLEPTQSVGIVGILDEDGQEVVVGDAAESNCLRFRDLMVVGGDVQEITVYNSAESWFVDRFATLGGLRVTLEGSIQPTEMEAGTVRVVRPDYLAGGATRP